MGETNRTNQSSPLLTVLTSSATLIAGILATIGIGAGVILALLRSTAAVTMVAIAIGLLGVVLGVSSILPARSDKVISRRTPLAVLSLCLTLLSIMILVWLTANYLGTTYRPVMTMSVTAPDKPGGFAILDLTVTASGMKSDQRYEIRVLLLDSNSNPAHEELIFGTFAGGSSEGKLDYRLHLPFQPREGLPWVAATALLETEDGGLRDQQTCGLAAPSSSASPEAVPTSLISESPTVAAIPLATRGTTCAFAVVPAFPSPSLSTPQSPSATPSP